MLSREAAVSAAVVVAKMNVDKLPEVRQNLDIKGFPTLRWYPAMSTTPVEFTGKRDADGMLLFIKQKLGERESWSPILPFCPFHAFHLHPPWGRGSP